MKKNEELTQDIREWTCKKNVITPMTGTSNAAINILEEGLKILKKQNKRK